MYQLSTSAAAFVSATVLFNYAHSLPEFAGCDPLNIGDEVGCWTRGSVVAGNEVPTYFRLNGEDIACDTKKLKVNVDSDVLEVVIGDEFETDEDGTYTLESFNTNVIDPEVAAGGDRAPEIGDTVSFWRACHHHSP